MSIGGLGPVNQPYFQQPQLGPKQQQEINDAFALFEQAANAAKESTPPGIIDTTLANKCMAALNTIQNDPNMPDNIKQQLAPFGQGFVFSAFEPPVGNQTPLNLGNFDEAYLILKRDSN